MSEIRTAYQEAMRQIDDADIPASVYRTAIRLLNLAADDGHTKLTRAMMMNLCDSERDSTMRSHLWQLRSAGIIHYSTNENVYVDFCAWSPRAETNDLIAERAKVSTSEPEPDTESTAEDEPRAPGARNDRQGARESYHGARKFRVGAGGKELSRESRDLDPDLGSQLNPPPTPPSDPERRWAYELLTDEEINITPANAVAAVKHHTAGHVLKQVAAWWVERERAARDPRAEPITAGLLFWRLMNPGRYRPGPANAEFLASDLYRRHYDAAWELAGDDPPQWVQDLPDPPRVLEYQSADGQVFRVPDDAEERRRRYGGAP